MKTYEQIIRDFEAQLALPDVAELHISHRVWNAITYPEIEVVTPDPWGGAPLKAKNGIPLIVKEELVDDEMHAVTYEMKALVERVSHLVLVTMRQTRVKPEAIEMGTNILALYQGAKKLYRGLYHDGIPIRVSKEDPDLLKVMEDGRPPFWCKVGTCIALKNDHETWGMVVGIQCGKVIVDELNDVPRAPIPVVEFRDNWVEIPPRTRVRNRFARVLDE